MKTASKTAKEMTNQMCEIHYIAADMITKEDAEEMSQMLVSGAESNGDGFGITNGKQILKKAGKYQATYRKLLYSLKGEKYLLAHNRLGTHGEKTDDNAHPFDTKDFLYVHNGVLYNYKEIAEKTATECPVDSNAIGAMLEFNKSKPLEENVKECLETIQGSYSIFIYHKPTQRMFYARNSSDFHYRLYKSKDRTVLAGSTYDSTMDSIYTDYLGEDINGMKHKEYNNIAELHPEEEYIYEINGTSITKKEKFTAKTYERPKKKEEINGTTASTYMKEYYENLEKEELDKWSETYQEWLSDSTARVKQNKNGYFKIDTTKKARKFLKKLGFSHDNLTFEEIAILPYNCCTRQEWETMTDSQKEDIVQEYNDCKKAAVLEVNYNEQVLDEIREEYTNYDEEAEELERKTAAKLFAIDSTALLED